MSDGRFGDPYLQCVLECIVCSESLVYSTVQDSKMVKRNNKKSSAFASDGCLNESLSEDYCELLASMFHAATSIEQGVETHTLCLSVWVSTGFSASHPRQVHAVSFCCLKIIILEKSNA